MKSNSNKNGLILCSCGNNISNFVDLERIAAWAKESKRFSFVARHELLCSPAGKEYFRALLKKNQPDQIVIAACSPKMHEETFKQAAQDSTTDPGRIQMANIREQSAWVTPEREEATQKAIALIRAAVERVQLHEKLPPKFMDAVTDIVVIGGGLAGMEAALLAAEAGRRVTLVEKNLSLGGRVIQSEELAPPMECAACLLAPRLAKIREHPNIQVITNAEVKDVCGFYGNFKVAVHRRARFVKEACIGCEECFAVCPVSVPSEFHLGLGPRKAIYTLFPGAVPAAAAIDREHCLHFVDGSCEACVKACPFGAVDFAEQDEEIEIPAGAILLATGSRSYDLRDFPNLGYGRLENVYTLPEFERLACSNGPTQGRIQLKNGNPPSSVAVIHCAGSLTARGLPYCSGTCCLLAAKVGDFVRKQNPQARVVNLHDRLVFQGSKAQAFFASQVKSGTQFKRVNDLSTLAVARDSRGLRVTAAGLEPVQAEMVILASGFGAGEDQDQLAQLLSVDSDASGFFKPDQFFLRSVGASLDGVYMVGGCAGPCLADAAVNQAQAAAGEAVSRLVPGRKISLETMVSEIDSELCSGCKMCVSVCPYKAVRFNSESGISEINEAICRGCGTCVANCPSGAARAKHFTDEQINAELEGIIHE